MVFSMQCMNATFSLSGFSHSHSASLAALLCAFLFLLSSLSAHPPGCSSRPFLTATSASNSVFLLPSWPKVPSLATR